MIYVAFYKHKKRITGWRSLCQRLADAVIRLLTRSRYSHCEIAVKRDSGLFNCYSLSPCDGGVRKKTMDLPASRWDLVPVSIGINRVFSQFNRCMGKGYDWLGVFGFVLRKSNQIAIFAVNFARLCLNSMTPTTVRNHCMNN